MKNLSQFIALIEKYLTMTPEEIIRLEGEDITLKTAERLTGFGSFATCTLCQSADPVIRGAELEKEPNCKTCVWTWLSGRGYDCKQGDNSATYDRISEAETPQDLSEAYLYRAARMIQLLYQFELISESLYKQLRAKL